MNFLIFIFHRDQEYQRFIIDVVGIKDILNKNHQNPATLMLVQNFYSLCIQILERIKNMDTLLSYISRQIKTKDSLSITYFEENEPAFGTIEFNKL